MAKDNIELDVLLGQRIKKIVVDQNTVFDEPRSKLIADKVLIYLDTKVLVIKPLTETDEIEILIKDSVARESSWVDILGEFVNSKLSYTWQCFNTNNYFDVFMLAFGSLRPSMAVLSEGSALNILVLEELC
jgi:hypothetical protein